MQYVMLNRSYTPRSNKSRILHGFHRPSGPLWLAASSYLPLVLSTSTPRCLIHKKLGEEADAMASFFAPAQTIGTQSGHILQQTALHTMPTTEIPIQENVACNRCLSLQYCQVASTIILTAVRHRIVIAISGGPEKMRERYDSGGEGWSPAAVCM
jgi:hypothetical protein